jgi:DNA-binding NarL/FixJ family response regulator
MPFTFAVLLDNSPAVRDNSPVKTKAAPKAGEKAPNVPSKQCRIVLVDDHALVRQGLAQLLNSRNELKVVGEGASAAEGIDLVRKHKPDLVILDVSLPKTDGLELVKQLKSELPNLAMLVISMHDESVYAERVLRAGARGYVMKKEPSEKIFAAIDQILRGEIYVSDRVKHDMLEFSVSGKRPAGEGDSVLDRLTDRELQVFQLLGNGISTREIAERLHLSVKTIETYRENLKVKLNVRNGAALVQRAIQWGKSQPG